MTGRTWLRWSLVVFAAIVLLAAGTLALLPRLLDTAVFRAHVTQAAGQAVGRPVKFASLSVSLLPLPNVTLRDLEIADDPRFGATPVLRVGEVTVRARLWPLLLLRIELASVTLDKAQVELVEAGGKWNVSTLAGAAMPAKTARRAVPGIPGATAAGGAMVSRISFTNAVVHVKRLADKRGDLRIQGINATVAGVGGADLDIRGEARVEPGGLRLRDIRASMGLRGGDMPIKASLDLEGADIAPLARALLAGSPEVSGPVKGKVQVSGPLARLSATGRLDLSRVTISEERSRCTPPKRRQLAFDDVRAPVLLKPTAFESAPLTAKLGKGSVALTVTAGLTEPSSQLLSLTHITIEGVELLPVLQGYLCHDFAVAGPLDLGGELSMRTADAWRSMNGAGRLKIGKGRVVGEGALRLVRDVLETGTLIDQALRGKFSGPGKTALDFDSITGTYRITAGVLRTDDLLYQSLDLKVAAVGTYALVDGRTDMNMVATQGSSQLRARVTGSGGSLRVIPTGLKVREPEEVKKLLDRLLR